MSDVLAPTKHNNCSHIVREIRRKAYLAKKIVFVHGDFNILHVGHLRFLNFAATCGDFLVVAVNAENSNNVYITENIRLATVQAVENVNYAFILHQSVEEFLQELKPDIIVKGKEFSSLDNPEKLIANSYGGKLLFSSGEIKFSDFNLLKKEFSEINFSTIVKPKDFLKRHNFTEKKLVNIINKFSNLRIVVIGDLIIDEYITCDPIGMSQEEPTIVVRPIKKDRFVGAAGIVAAHASQMGAKVSFFTVTNGDEVSQYAEQKLEEYGVTSFILADDTRPTTVKQRFQAAKKTLLRLNNLREHDLSDDLCEKQFNLIKPMLDKADLLIFSDFNYGALPQKLVDSISEYAKKQGVMIIADSQSSSQVGDISRFRNTTLITPTEHEARIAMQDVKSGIISVMNNLMKKSNCDHIILTLGEEGIIICNKIDDFKYELKTDRLPAFNSLARDVAGAGDSLLTGAGPLPLGEISGKLPI